MGSQAFADKNEAGLIIPIAKLACRVYQEGIGVGRFAIFFGAEGDPKPQAIQLIAHLPPALRVPRHHDVEKIWEIPFQPDTLANDAFFSFMSAAGQNDLGGFVDAQVRQDRPNFVSRGWIRSIVELDASA